MDQTLISFADLLRPDPSISAGERQRRAINSLPSVVAQSNLAWISPSELAKVGGDRLVIAVAAWSPQDLELLDSLDQYVAVNPDVRVYVTDVDEAFDQLIPGIGEVFQTPVVGRWVGGVLTQSGSGYAGRQIAHELIHPSRVASS